MGGRGLLLYVALQIELVPIHAEGQLCHREEGAQRNLLRVTVAPPVFALHRNGALCEEAELEVLVPLNGQLGDRGHEWRDRPLDKLKHLGLGSGFPLQRGLHLSLGHAAPRLVAIPRRRYQRGGTAS